MKLWLLEPRTDNRDQWAEDPWVPWYDKAFAFVVLAETEQEARQMANAEGGAETGPISHCVYRTGGDPWLDPVYSNCEELLPQGEPGVIVRDYASA